MIQKNIGFEDYKECLFSGTEQKVNEYTVMYKVALSANDNKRFILNDSMNMLALGHFSL